MPSNQAERVDAAHPRRRTPAASTPRRLARTALFAAVRGLAYASGTGAVGLLVWWLTNR